MKKASQIVLVLSIMLMAVSALALAAAAGKAEQAGGLGLLDGLKAVGAGLAFLGGAIGTGIAQSRIGAAVMGAIVEDSSNFGIGLILVALPETLVILGFVVALMLR